MNHIEALRHHYATQPHEVSIETLAQCNARCTFCPYPTLERIGTKLPDEVLDRLIEEMSGFEKPFYFSPFKVNEPLLDKRLIPLCETFNGKVPHGRLRIFTNGSALTETNLNGLARLLNVEHLWVSLNEHDPERYQALMGLDFERTATNLDRLHERFFPHPVVISRVGMDEAFQYYVHERWPKFGIALLKKDAWIDFTDAHSDVVPETACSRWWELNIAANGQEALCCMDGEARFGWGNVHEQTLLELYNHPVRKAWRDGAMMRQQAGNPCATCSY